ncbi:TetR family transcriptional regulator [Paractinoplanes deccanensis]|uniref:TetR family transcriptional regulator n=1 Tax=Paractinoplanes deccanensis TaxID=113561 RepID=A0ABQ3Y302_9ACTN|nr:TetR/AcrR family transcriptional regulator [Actinoplanes deccanensis]GID74250.1 TetR family transcriptional regulator [Actinoplanes deccanensis]
MARRADAERNRALVVRAAEEVFGEAGIDVPMSEVARRAGVGIATVMRNFPAREELIEETFLAAMRDYATAAAAAAADPDPWQGFRGFLGYLVRVQGGNRGFNQVLTTMFPGAERLEAERQAALRDFIRLVGRAKAAGKLRADFSPHDLPLFLLATSGVVRPGSEALAVAGRRLVAYLLRACEAGDTEPLPPAPGARELYRALENSSRGRPA